MTNLSDFYEEDLNMMAQYIGSYLGVKSKELTAVQGYQLGVLSCNFSYYGILIRAQKRGESLAGDDTNFIKNIDKILDSLPDLAEHLILSLAKGVKALEESNPELHKKFMESRGSHEKKQNAFK